MSSENGDQKCNFSTKRTTVEIFENAVSAFLLEGTTELFQNDDVIASDFVPDKNVLLLPCLF